MANRVESLLPAPMSSRSTRHGDGQDDVGVPRGGRPERVVHHHGLRPGERLAQPGEVLVVVERVAAAPVDELDVRVAAALPVVVVARAGMQQHVRDPGHRDVGAGTVRALGQTRRGDAGGPGRHRWIDPYPWPNPPPGSPIWPSIAASDHAQPHRLLAVLGALQRPADRDQRAPGRHLAGQRADPLRRARRSGRPPTPGSSARRRHHRAGRPRTAGSPPCTGPGSGDRPARRRPGRGRARASARRRCRARGAIHSAPRLASVSVAQRADRDDPASARHGGRQRRGHGVPGRCRPRPRRSSSGTARRTPPAGRCAPR